MFRACTNSWAVHAEETTLSSYKSRLLSLAVATAAALNDTARMQDRRLRRELLAPCPSVVDLGGVAATGCHTPKAVPPSFFTASEYRRAIRPEPHHLVRRHPAVEVPLLSIRVAIEPGKDCGWESNGTSKIGLDWIGPKQKELRMRMVAGGMEHDEGSNGRGRRGCKPSRSGSVLAPYLHRYSFARPVDSTHPQRNHLLAMLKEASTRRTCHLWSSRGASGQGELSASSVSTLSCRGRKPFATSLPSSSAYDTRAVSSRDVGLTCGVATVKVGRRWSSLPRIAARRGCRLS